MRQLRTAATLIAGYGAIVVLNALVNAPHVGDGSGLGRAAVRFAGALAVAYGLWRAARWAWWFAAIMTGLLGAAGATTLLAAGSGVFEGRPNPSLDVAFFAVTTAMLATAFVLLLLRPAREAVRAPRQPA